MTDSFAAAARRWDDIWARLRTDPTGFRVLTGERTTGALHIGHYFGSLQNRVALQGMGVEMFLVMADYQAITDRDADDAMADSVRNILLDYLAIRHGTRDHDDLHAQHGLGSEPDPAAVPERRDDGGAAGGTRPSRTRSRSPAGRR